MEKWPVGHIEAFWSMAHCYNNTRLEPYDAPMFTFRPRFWPSVLVLLWSHDRAAAQADETLLVYDEYWHLDTLVGADEAIDPYAGLNSALGGDSVRYCSGTPCSGWVEDHYPDGSLKHRGYYGEGRLITYRNHHPNGQLEREFKLKDNTRCSMRIYHDNGTLRSEAHYVDGASRTYSEHYTNGRLRYTEEKHPSLPCYVVMDLFAPDGQAVNSLHLVDKKRMVFDQREYWPNGQVRASGRSQFNKQRYDSQRIGAWTYYDTAGKPQREEHYVDGKVHETAELR